MSDPLSNQPFQPEAPRSSNAGCGRVALFGCGGLLLLLLISLVVVAFNVEKLTLWALEVTETRVMAHLPAETTDEDVRRIRDGFAGVKQSVIDKTVDPNALNRLQPLMLRFMDPNRRPSQEDVDELIVLLDQAAGIAPSEGALPEAAPAVP